MATGEVPGVLGRAGGLPSGAVRQSLSKKSAPHEAKTQKKNLKSQGYENCSTEHKLILTHFGENFNFYDKINLHLNSFPHPQQKAA